MNNMDHMRTSGTKPSSVILNLSKIEKVPRDIRRAQSGKITTSSIKDWSQQVEQMQVPKGRDQVSGGVSVPCWHATPVAYILLKPLQFGNVNFGKWVIFGKRHKKVVWFPFDEQMQIPNGIGPGVRRE